MNEIKPLTREQAIALINFKLPALSDSELRGLIGFIRGIEKGRGKQ